MSGQTLLQKLYADPRRFEFFQAVAILERAAANSAETDSGMEPPAELRGPIGHDTEPRREAVRFRAEQTRSFADTEIADLVAAATGTDGPPEMTVSFMGLTGASGVLPLHYTDAVIEASRRARRNHRPPPLRNFFDLINHRAVSLFFRAWEKYRLPATYNLAPTGTDDPITAALFALIGFGTPGLRGRLGLEDQTLLRYSGLLSHQPRSAVGLEAMLSDDLGQPVTLEQFRGAWIAVRLEDQTRMPDRNNPDGHFCRLGVDTVVGDRVWDVQGGFRLRLGPLSYPDFLKALPGGAQLPRIARLTRLYVGPDMSFDLQLILAGPEVPELCLDGGNGPESPRLGWNTWLKHAPRSRDADDAVFSLDHISP
ncbi:MAG: type VI secretion system baseplate subunit TssG [Rhodospirillaceae bacterium]